MDHTVFQEHFESFEEQLSLRYDLLPKGKYYQIPRLPAIVAITSITVLAATLLGTSYYAARKAIDSKVAQASVASIQAKEKEAHAAVDRLNAADARLAYIEQLHSKALTRLFAADTGRAVLKRDHPAGTENPKHRVDLGYAPAHVLVSVTGWNVAPEEHKSTSVTVDVIDADETGFAIELDSMHSENKQLIAEVEWVAFRKLD